MIAVPPLARNPQGKVCQVENEKIIHFLELGGVDLLLYGGNALFYHLRFSEYADVLQMLATTVADSTGVIPSVGPAYGLMMDQIDVLKDFDFPTAMVLPAREIQDAAGLASGIRDAAQELQRPLVLYIKFDRWMDPADVRRLYDDGLISWIKYAVVRENPSEDAYLRELLDVVPGERIVSGIGEQPAIVHMREFGVNGFTSGCVCVAPQRSMQMLQAIQEDDLETAEAIRQSFAPLEELRNEINPIRVLHHAVQEAGIAKTGSMLPMVSDLSSDLVQRVAVGTRETMATG